MSTDCFVSTKAVLRSDVSLRSAMDPSMQLSMDHLVSVSAQAFAIEKKKNSRSIWFLSQKGCMDSGMGLGFLASTAFTFLSAGAGPRVVLGDFRRLLTRRNSIRRCVENTTPWKQFFARTLCMTRVAIHVIRQVALCTLNTTAVPESCHMNPSIRRLPWKLHFNARLRERRWRTPPTYREI